MKKHIITIAAFVFYYGDSVNFPVPEFYKKTCSGVGTVIGHGEGYLLMDYNPRTDKYDIPLKVTEKYEVKVKSGDQCGFTSLYFETEKLTKNGK